MIVPIKMCQENWEFWHKVAYLRFKIAKPGLPSLDLKKEKAQCTVFLPTFHSVVCVAKIPRKYAGIAGNLQSPFFPSNVECLIAHFIRSAIPYSNSIY